MNLFGKLHHHHHHHQFKIRNNIQIKSTEFDSQIFINEKKNNNMHMNRY